MLQCSEYILRCYLFAANSKCSIYAEFQLFCSKQYNPVISYPIFARFSVALEAEQCQDGRKDSKTEVSAKMLQCYRCISLCYVFTANSKCSKYAAFQFVCSKRHNSVISYQIFTKFCRVLETEQWQVRHKGTRMEVVAEYCSVTDIICNVSRLQQT